ncbi:Tankyrase-like Protein [Tribolium castaneum]|uniref:Tankyrase-like Protein n=1 Tax=Tribolium castaneum TaxID=7070 RepID=D6X569_TRICA|nr:PREDICTED: ankyrin repeat and death domain-containing protein 1A isoform X1 [Tribolium castaneum]EEZ97168.2 Tankyrase-like Protein [Tribolium castaneum]|eukprot:XP_008200352.1 PREDICTED: ankyrin repeat and death domain-containing protein 1A isoform X1 [Tribolium castaneum]
MMSCMNAAAELDHGCALRPGCPSPTSTPEELERRALIQRNDLLLHEAVIKNDTECVRRILKEPVDINSRNNYGRAPIHWAASRGNIDIMEMLIAANCDIEARDKYGMRPLLMACWHGHRDAVQLLINTGACSNATNKKHYTLLMCAARNNRISVVDFLIDTLEDTRVDAVDIDSQTALFHAAMGGHIEIVKRLIDLGANLNKRSKESRTALHVACERGHCDVAELLLNHEADMEAKDTNGNTPLHVASQNQQTELVHVLLETGADPDSENLKGSTPLHIASSLGSKGILEILLQHGASINKQNKNGNTSLHIACQANVMEMVEILISKGANLNSLNARLQSPIHIAAEMGHTEICKVLLAAGADIEQREQGGRTPLYIAARGSFTAIVDMIIKTARLDYPAHEDPNERKDNNGFKQSLSTARSKWRSTKEDIRGRDNNERLKEILYKVAYKQLGPGEWKMLAHHWAFTDEQIKAIEHQYNGPSSYKEHGFRMMLIWSHGLGPDVNPIRELYESLTAVGKRPLADALRRKIDQENETRRKGNQQNCCTLC